MAAHNVAICLQIVSSFLLIALSRVIGDRRGITTAGQVALMTLGYRKVVIRIRKSAGRGYPCRFGQPSQGLRRAPQIPHNSATRRPIPTGIPRTKRHTPVHLLCVLKIRKITGQQRRCARAGLLAAFPGKCSRGDRPPEKRKLVRCVNSCRVCWIDEAVRRRGRGSAMARVYARSDG